MKNIFKAVKITILETKFYFVIYVALLFTITLLPAIQLDCYQNIFSGLQCSNISKIFYTLCIYVAFDICSSLITSVNPLLKEKIRNKVEKVLYRNLMDYLDDLPIDFFDASDNLCEIERAKKAAKQVIIDIVAYFIRVIGSIIALIYLFNLLSSVSITYYFVFFSLASYQMSFPNKMSKKVKKSF